MISAGQSNWDVFWFTWGEEWGDLKLHLVGVGKFKWVGIRIKICWSDYKF